jgi:hypothetical protein
MCLILIALRLFKQANTVNDKFDIYILLSSLSGVNGSVTYLTSSLAWLG